MMMMMMIRADIQLTKPVYVSFSSENVFIFLIFFLTSNRCYSPKVKGQPLFTFSDQVGTNVPKSLQAESCRKK